MFFFSHLYIFFFNVTVRSTRYIYLLFFRRVLAALNKRADVKFIKCGSVSLVCCVRFSASFSTYPTDVCGARACVVFFTCVNRTRCRCRRSVDLCLWCIARECVCVWPRCLLKVLVFIFAVAAAAYPAPSRRRCRFWCVSVFRTRIRWTAVESYATCVFGRVPE